MLAGGDCRFRGPPGYATPYVSELCFEPAYVAPDGEQVSFSNYARIHGPVRCGQQTPNSQVAADRMTSAKPSSFYTHNMRVMARGPNNTVTAYDPASGAQSQWQVLDLPLGPTGVNPQCTNALKTVWPCERFATIGDWQGYNTCQVQKQCFSYDLVAENGSLLPLAVRQSPECQAYASAALRQCASQCGQCVPSPMH